MLEAAEVGVLLANGNRMKGVGADFELLLESPELQKRVQEYNDLSKREKQFSELILHVIEQIEKENSEELPTHTDLWPEISMLDMKKFLKADVSVPGVSENSPIFVLDCVNGKVGQTLHNFNVYEISQLAACTKVEISHMFKQAKGIFPGELEVATQDAKSIMGILSVKKEQKVKEANSWNSWGSLSQVSNLLQIKENGQKFANLMETLSPKHLTTSIVDVFTSAIQEDDDINSFEEI